LFVWENRIAAKLFRRGNGFARYRPIVESGSTAPWFSAHGPSPVGLALWDVWGLRVPF